MSRIKTNDASHSFDTVADTDLLSIPEVIRKDIESKGWVCRWLNNRRLIQNGGQDLRGYIAYRVPDNLRIEMKPGVYAEDYQVAPDGFFHRGDLILGVMPRAKRDAARQKIERETKLQLGQLTEKRLNTPGVSVDKVEVRRGSLPSTKDIIGD